MTAIRADQGWRDITMPPKERAEKPYSRRLQQPTAWVMPDLGLGADVRLK